MSGLRSLIPIADRVLVRRIVAQTKTAGGIFLPESTVSKANEGEILAVGPGLRTKDGHIAMSVAVGDKVLLPEFGGLMIKMDGEDVYLFRNDEILAKFSN